MKLSMFGTGYVGLVSAACFAELGNDVLCYDIDEAKIATLADGGVPFYEPGLAEMVRRNIHEGRLRFTTDVAEAARFGEIVFLAVGTPPAKNGEPDLRFVWSAVGAVGEHLAEPRRIIVMKSTVPVGTSKEVRRIIAEKLRGRGMNLEFAVASNPEFLKEGEAINDFMKPDRIVVGADEPWARERMRELYASFVEENRPLHVVATASSEMSKYAANALLAAKISFMNQIANLCELVDADVEEVRAAIAADTRIGPHFLAAGVGYGGSCFPKDVQALAATARKLGMSPILIEAIEAVNEAQKKKFAATVVARIGHPKGKRIAIWGLAFKPRTDDMRAAPSIPVVEELLRHGAEIHAFDPIAVSTAKQVFGDRIRYSEDMYAALDGADALIIVTEWPQFREPDFARMASLMKAKLVVDGRNVYDPARMKELGFTYVSIGRP